MRLFGALCGRRARFCFLSGLPSSLRSSPLSNPLSPSLSPLPRTRLGKRKAVPASLIRSLSGREAGAVLRDREGEQGAAGERREAGRLPRERGLLLCPSGASSSSSSSSSPPFRTSPFPIFSASAASPSSSLSSLLPPPLLSPPPPPRGASGGEEDCERQVLVDRVVGGGNDQAEDESYDGYDGRDFRLLPEVYGGDKDEGG